VAVGADGGSKGAKDGSGLDLGRHCSVGCWKVWIGVQKGTSRSTKIVKNVRRFKRWKVNESERK
jgi:hypothetical protein